MTRDELEISISQYLDGTLGEDERLAVEARLADDAEAQALLAEDRELTAALRSVPLPEVHWDRLAESISSAIDDQLAERTERASWWLRLRMPAGLAVAASALLAIGIAVHVLQRPSAGIKPNPNPNPGMVAVAASSVLVIEGPQADAPTGHAVAEITIGAGGSYAKDASLSPYADELDSRPSRVVIASANPPERPRAMFPY